MKNIITTKHESTTNQRSRGSRWLTPLLAGLCLIGSVACGQQESEMIFASADPQTPLESMSSAAQAPEREAAKKKVPEKVPEKKAAEKKESASEKKPLIIKKPQGLFVKVAFFKRQHKDVESVKTSSSVRGTLGANFRGLRLQKVLKLERRDMIIQRGLSVAVKTVLNNRRDQDGVLLHVSAGKVMRAALLVKINKLNKAISLLKIRQSGKRGLVYKLDRQGTIMRVSMFKHQVQELCPKGTFSAAVRKVRVGRQIVQKFKGQWKNHLGSNLGTLYGVIDDGDTFNIKGKVNKAIGDNLKLQATGVALGDGNFAFRGAWKSVVDGSPFGKLKGKYYDFGEGARIKGIWKQFCPQKRAKLSPTMEARRKKSPTPPAKKKADGDEGEEEEMEKKAEEDAE